MKIFITFVAVIAIVNAFSFNSFLKRTQQERDEVTCSIKTACNSIGGKCTTLTAPQGCTDCVTAAYACAIGANATVTCGCFQTLFSCLSAVASPLCPVGAYSSSCKSSTAGTSCNCNPATTAPYYYMCQQDAYCNNATAVCTSLIGDGGSGCTRSADCGYANQPYTFMDFSCTNGICKIDAGQHYVNDGCTTSSDCVGTTTCTGGKCVGFAAGATCSRSEECQFGYYCHGGKCMAQSASGASCMYDDVYSRSGDACVIGNDCVSGKCVEFFSVGSGGSCNDSIVCNAGLVCNMVTYKCQAEAPAKSCYNDTECPANAGYGDCQCDLNGNAQCDKTYAFTSGAATAYKNLIKCANTNKCTGMSQIPGSCAQMYCSDQVNCVLNDVAAIQLQGCQGAKAKCSSASIINISLFFLATLIAVLLL